MRKAPYQTLVTHISDQDAITRITRHMGGQRVSPVMPVNITTIIPSTMSSKNDFPELLLALEQAGFPQIIRTLQLHGVRSTEDLLRLSTTTLKQLLPDAAQHHAL